MSDKDDGGPAFPVSDVMALEPRTTAEMVSLAHGMTLRDYFAAHASDEDVQGIMSKNVCPEWIAEVSGVDGLFSKPRYTITRQQARYIHADAMLEARK